MAASVYNLRLPPKASGEDTGAGPAPGFKRLRATAGQGPNHGGRGGRRVCRGVTKVGASAAGGGSVVLRGALLVVVGWWVSVGWRRLLVIRSCV